MIRDTKESYGLVTILFHWIMAGPFFYQFWLGLTMMGELDVAARDAMRAQHISFGLLILFLWVGRVAWRLASKKPELPAGMERNLRPIARLSHWALYGLLMVTPLAGWAILSTKAFPQYAHFFSLFSMPRLPLTPSPNASGVWSGMHAFLAYMLLFLALVHMLAAFRHQFRDRDGLLSRMLWPGVRLAEKSSDQP
ncbi:cytochrome b [Rhizobium sp. L1K21]|uniref:cytochrome b n=1 Tax=Rhizobium sp. L1K21 TaxID=2954933 RepID=UPI0020921D75|nr:cytochrome b [Rhizobium sp. L1K21]MCO6186321.1 cytochrome b [Rhizobium sp. L1K21]